MGEFITCGHAARYRRHLLTQRIGKYIVAGIGGILFATGVVVGRGGVNGVTNAGGESDLGYQKRLSTGTVNVYMDVWRPARIPAWENARKTHLAIGIRYLTPTQEVDGGEIGLLHPSATVFGVVTIFVTMPDVDNCPSQRFATRIEVFDVDFYTQEDACTIRTDVDHL